MAESILTKKDIERVNPDAKMRKCLGEWCGHKEFFSTGPGNRYCKKCSTKKDQLQASASGIRIVPGSGED
jgi:hypothetical protein